MKLHQHAAALQLAIVTAVLLLQATAAHGQSCGDPTAGSCFEPNQTPACDNQKCCQLVCTIDPFCCDVQWDANCANAATDLCELVTGCPGTGSCLKANGTPGCADVKCCQLVCAADPFCCDTEWDPVCADQALMLCQLPVECPGPGLCFEANGTPGCIDQDCCQLVCSLDAFCCETEWDSTCANQARFNCNLDHDFDGVPTEIDNCPFIFNPGQNPAACQENVTVDQVEFFATDGTPQLPPGGYGLFGLHLPNLEDQILFVNAEISGEWQIQNWPISARDFAVDAPTESFYTAFPLSGVPAVEMRVYVSPLRVDTGVPDQTPVSPVSTGTFPQSPGEVSTVIDTGPGAAEGPATFGGEGGTDAETIETASKPVEFNMVDLNDNSDSAACAPGAVASSFVWLNRTYCLGDPKKDTPAATKDAALEELKKRMKTTKAGGTEYENIAPAKSAYIRKHKLPIKIKGAGRGSPNPDDAINPDDLFKEMKLGEDVEIHIRWGGDDFENKGHTTAVVAMKKVTNKDGTVCYTMTRHDDGDQDGAGGNDRKVDGKLEHRDTDGDDAPDTWFYVYSFNTSKIVGWVSESPTNAAMNRAIAQKSDALATLLGDLGDSATEDQANDILKKACHLKYIADRLKDHLDCKPASTDAQKMKAAEIAQSAAELKALAKQIKELVGNDAQAAALEEAAEKASEIKTKSDELKDLFPPDKDFDDIPDDDDNAPNDANPDQADCNDDGVGDVTQLGENDCNDNAIPDDCDIADGTSEDTNDNDIPDECDLANGDVNLDGMVNVQDLIIVINGWGPCEDPTDCPGDTNGDVVVDVTDLVTVITNWG